MSSDQRKVIEQTKFTCFPGRKVLQKQRKTIKDQEEKQLKTIEDQGEKQIKALENRTEKNFLDTKQKSITSLFPKDFLNEKATYELNKIVEMEYKLDRNDSNS